ncbi:PREDICTED: uncharacterized protein LOC108561549 isoform X2 [Nicrophorus vespilloides]|uniref:Uncharacterized protein LOC108561549 isoform X2 n=1 Tax=Nicrophorus vespilloides TaxID=110193 RepID=A0ABM1MKD0_NICVS|nr:PREDICTED: uncharacterized protein LOC108561549 isoform X2 [Nicrophorus vespilloides]
MSLVRSENLSVDSLEVCKAKVHDLPLSCEQIVSSSNLQGSFYLKPKSLIDSTGSITSVCSDPFPKGSNKVGFVKTAMEDYLNSHRHSLSSVMELLNRNETLKIPLDDVDDEADDESVIEEEPAIDQRRFSQQDCYYTLSPIEEYSEPSSCSSKDVRSFYNLQTMSSSCEPIPSDIDYELTDKYDTFPRAKSRQVQYYNNTLYPLEPRELDPNAFNQLHTVDSQEELQEFLLLESACLSDSKGRGLASAFSDQETD